VNLGSFFGTGEFFRTFEASGIWVFSGEVISLPDNGRAALLRVSGGVLFFEYSLSAQNCEIRRRGHQGSGAFGRSIKGSSVGHCPRLGGLKPSPLGDGFQRVRAG